MKKIVLKSVLLSALLLPVGAVAGENISIGTQVGIFGIGANAKYKINDQFGVRAGFDMFSIEDFEIEDDEVTYNFDVELQDVMFVADWHPWKGSFKTSAGLIINGSNVDGDITPTATSGENIEFDFNGVNYSYAIDDLGAIQTTADFDPVAPYIGIGWDTSFNKDKGFGFTFDLGIAFQGSIQTDYSLRFGDSLDIDKATAGMSDGAAKDQLIAEITAERERITNELKTELDREMVTLQDELDKYEIMPYVSIGFNYKF